MQISFTINVILKLSQVIASMPDHCATVEYGPTLHSPNPLTLTWVELSSRGRGEGWLAPLTRHRPPQGFCFGIVFENRVAPTGGATNGAFLGD